MSAQTSNRKRTTPTSPGRRSGPTRPTGAARKAVVAAVLVVVLLGLYLSYSNGSSGAGSAVGTTPASDFQVGEPGVGANAPSISLAATTGSPVQLADYRGKSVLLYFQEGLGCQPCWDQLRDLEARTADLAAAGIDEIVTVTTDPVELLARKAADEGLTTPVLSDPDLSVSREYETNSFGMMGDSRNGHSFVLVDPDGKITWRADYGGAPKYTMFVPVDRLLADLKAATS
jgi:peroxiredoxin Q/BCP